MGWRGIMWRSFVRRGSTIRCVLPLLLPSPRTPSSSFFPTPSCLPMSRLLHHPRCPSPSFRPQLTTLLLAPSHPAGPPTLPPRSKIRPARRQATQAPPAGRDRCRGRLQGEEVRRCFPLLCLSPSRPPSWTIADKYRLRVQAAKEAGEAGYTRLVNGWKEGRMGGAEDSLSVVVCFFRLSYFAFAYPFGFPFSHLTIVAPRLSSPRTLLVFRSSTSFYRPFPLVDVSSALVSLQVNPSRSLPRSPTTRD